MGLSEETIALVDVINRAKIKVVWVAEVLQQPIVEDRICRRQYGFCEADTTRVELFPDFLMIV